MSETVQATRLPLIGDEAPDFNVESTHGHIKLSDYRGKWVVLFSHPADFTPVCTTEFIEFARRNDEFEQRNIQLIGNSVDSIFSHIGWIRSIEENTGLEVKFPVVADIEMEVRAVFVIDDKGIIRALVYYPLNAGRNIDEILRLVDALQTVDREGVSCPANWTPGDDVVVGAPRTTADLRARLEDDNVNLTDWYLAKKQLAK